VRRRSGEAESFQLRERFGPAHDAAAESAAQPEVESPESPEPREEPTGPRAKTQELKLPPGANGPSVEARTEAAADATDRDARGEMPKSGESAYGADDAGLAVAPAAEHSRAESETAPAAVEPEPAGDLGEVFGKVLALSLTLNHPSFVRALDGFAHDDRVYLVYADESLVPLSERKGGLRMEEPEAIAAAVQVCQAVSVLARRGLRLNDLCPQSLATDALGRIRVAGLDYVTNDDEISAEPVLNDGYTAPEIYRGKRVDKRADVFSVGALLYTFLTGERLACESWRGEAGTVSFYPPHVVTPALEQAVRRALSFEPRERWATADDFKAELLKLGAALTIRAAALTDVGMVRDHNEDSVLALEVVRDTIVNPMRMHLYVVADGMGGAEAGEIASALAVDAVRGAVENGLCGADAGADHPALLKAALEEANQRILEYQAAHPESRGMGSTAVALLISEAQAAVGWVGDSRAYLLESGALRQLTKDHSLVQRLIEIGQLTAEEARTHEHKNVITRSLGARQGSPAGAESLGIRLRRGDRMLLCSDGLTAHVDDGAIREIVARHRDPFACARELVVAANAGGGTDNVSVIVVFVN
jgi:serine/threonine protein phosphatase PrpC